MIGISACLGGIFCRYDGKTNTILQLQEYVQQGRAVPICPEVLGGLPTPREPAEIKGGDGFAVWQNTARVIDKKGYDRTEAFQEGAKLAYEKLRELGITTIVTKEKSPSCGHLRIYDGSFSGNQVAGVGVATAYFLQQGLTVLSDEEWLAKIAAKGGLEYGA